MNMGVLVVGFEVLPPRGGSYFWGGAHRGDRPHPPNLPRWIWGVLVPGGGV